MTAVTPLLARFRAGSESAFAQLFANFYPSHVAHAGTAVAGCGYLVDGEDVAQSAFLRLWHEGTRGKFPDGLNDTAGFLAVLGILIDQKARKVRRFERQARRDVRRTVRAEAEAAEFFVARGEPGPDPAADLPSSLTPRQRDVARMLGEGWLVTEIAARLGCSVRTVARERREVLAVLRDAHHGE
ncbi:MAG: LuxR C-terminal-related transcriptional regulator [Gemmataceae bacterium]|nr:LuxR C-terminal-related transcriptional regulator [Gemmataceae bacterium]